MIRTEQAGGVVNLVIDRPERRNAFDPASAKALADGLQAARIDS